MRIRGWSFFRAVLLVLGAGLSFQGRAQDGASVVSESGLGSGAFRIKGEIKAHARDSRDLSLRIALPDGSGVPMQTVSPNGSLEVSNVAVTLEADVTPDILARAVVHFIDLYNRNPTSSDDRISLREAWLRFGKKYEPLKLPPGSSIYVQAGKFPRFTKQLTRRLESYGLWGTAVGRLEEVGLEAGGSIGKNFYVRAHVVNGNPLFMRDTNALAGDHGTPDRAPGSIDPPVYGTGFPILYDGKATDVNFSGQFQTGVGAGARFAGSGWGVDALGWYVTRQLRDRVPFRGSFYQGDIELLKGVQGVGLPLDGRDKTEYGANLEARWKGLQLFGQYIHQDIAGNVRKGYEIEVAYRIPLPGVFASGDSPVINWIQPVVRVSRIDSDFPNPPGFVAKSWVWDWGKYDFGIRLGIVRGVDFTAEYARHDMIRPADVLHPDEFLATLRVGF